MIKECRTLLCNTSEIAEYQITIDGKKCKIDIPAFQRGLVWNSAQIEALWDSIMRGIPIGCISLIHYQDKSGNKDSEEDKPEFGVFDGQQRINAISLGQKDHRGADAIVWIDLLPDFKKSSSRKYHIYVTTKGQPWGYKINDNGTEAKNERLSAVEKRNAIDISRKQETIKENYLCNNIIELDAKNKFAKPMPEYMWPYEANCPVPLHILLEVSNGLNEGEDFKVALFEKLKNYTGELWYDRVVSKCIKCYEKSICVSDCDRNGCLFSNEYNSHLKLIEEGIKNAKNASVIVVITPQTFSANDGSTGTGDAKTVNGESTAEIDSDIAVFFARLNRGGTVPTQEDLNYSILKSIIPDLGKIDREPYAKDRMQPARLASLAMRLYLIERDKEHKWRAGITNRDVYKIANACPEDKQNFIEFIDDLASILKKLDDFLLNEQNGKAIPKYVLSSFINKKPDLYLLYLLIASKTHDANSQKNDLWISSFMMLGLYGTSSDYKEVCEMIFRDDFVCSDFQSIFQQIIHMLATTAKLFIPPPVEVYDKIKRATKNDEEKDVINAYKGRRAILDNAWNPPAYRDAVNRIWSWDSFEARMLLLYACREYINETFPNYNPVDSTWSEDNCPWDYDHIFPRNWLPYYKRHGEFQDYLADFIDCIGNIAPIPSSQNRARHDDPPYTLIDNSYKYAGGIEDGCLAQLTDIDSVDDFKHLDTKPDSQHRIDKDEVQTFSLGRIVLHRLHRVYKKVYDDLHWEQLLDFESIDKRSSWFAKFSHICEENKLTTSEPGVWCVDSNGKQVKVSRETYPLHEWGRVWLAYGFEVFDAHNNQKLGLACICSNGKAIEWGIRRHPDVVDVSGNTNCWWLENKDNLDGWQNGLLYKSEDLSSEVDMDSLLKRACNDLRDLRDKSIFSFELNT